MTECMNMQIAASKTHEEHFAAMIRELFGKDDNKIVNMKKYQMIQLIPVPSIPQDRALGAPCVAFLFTFIIRGDESEPI